MEIIVNNKKKIEGQKPIFDFQSVSPVTIKTDQDFSSVSGHLYLAGSRVFKDQNKLLFFSTDYQINGNFITFNVDTYTENYLKYINQPKTSFNLQFAAKANEKTIFLLDKAFANPRVYVEGVPPSGELAEYYTKPEVDDILSTNYWTKLQVAQAIADIQTMDIEVLSALPPISAGQEYTIYLVPAALSETGNFYDQYLIINGQYELVGSTTIDMSQYVRKDTDNTLSGVNKFDGYCQFTSGVSFGYNSIDGCSIFSQNYTVGSAPWGRAGSGSFAANLGEARGRYSFACDSGIATGERSFACGISTNAVGVASFAQGRNSIANYQYSHAEGYYVSTGENYQHVEGKYNVVTSGAHIIGGGTDENNRKNISVLDWDGNLSIAGAFSCPSGISLNVDGTIGKFVQGYAVGSTEWNSTGTASFAAGTSKVTGNYSFAAGDNNTVQGNYCYALGRNNTVLGLYNTAAGLFNSLAGAYNSAFGYACSVTSQRNYCFVVGNYCNAGDNCQFVTGRFNLSTTGARVTGNGTSSTDRKNIEVLDWNGNLTIAGDLTFVPSGAVSGVSLTEQFNKYQEKINSNNISTSSITLSSNTFLKITQPLTEMDLTIPSGLSDAIIFFKTGDTFEYNISYPSGSYINQNFDFSPSAAYIISVENDIILWSDLIEKE